jgi:hypothetical protein
VDALCTALRPQVGTLVDGFGIPEHWLGSSLVPTSLDRIGS